MSQTSPEGMRRRMGQRGVATDSSAAEAAWVPPERDDAVLALHDALGNSIVLDALGGGDVGGIGPLLGGEVALANAGLMSDGFAGSNADMQRAWRHSQAAAEGIDMGRAQDLIHASSGAPLPQNTRDRMERAFGHRFDHVRVHTSGTANQAAEELHAHAFALGADVFFASGAYAPGTSDGDRLLAHELTHVVQHDERRLPAGRGDVSNPNDRHEVEAYQNERQIVRVLATLDRQGTQLDRQGTQTTRGPLPEAAEKRVHGGATHVEAEEDLEEALAEEFRDARAAGGLETDGGVAAHQVGTVTDTDLERATRTASLLPTLARILHLPSSSIAIDVTPEAGERLNALGASGLMENGRVLLHPDRFDPSTPDGRALLAHETTHVAQARLASPTVSNAEYAEAEATLAGQAFATGQSISRVAIGLPPSHSARDTGGSNSADLMQMVQDLKSKLDADASGLASEASGLPAPRADLKPPAQDRAEKMKTYKKGVDGIADQIGDLSAFDDLCDAHGAADMEKRKQALARLRRAEEFTQLAEMWAGALAGGEDQAEMQEIFTKQFDSRGWRKKTKKAFDDVEAAAKRKGRQLYDAKRAEQERAEQAQRDGELLAGEEGESASDEEGGDSKGSVSGKTPAGPQSVQDLQAAEVAAVAPRMPEFEMAQTRMESGSLWSAITTEYEHHNAFLGEVNGAAEGGFFDRAGLVFSNMIGGFAEGLIGGFVGAGLDGLIIDTLGSLGDYALFTLSKGTFKAPLIGPALGLAQMLYDPNAFVEGLGSNLNNMLEGGGRGVANFAKAWDRGWSWDSFGLVLAGIADFLGSIAELLTFLTTLAQVLSGICYVVGGIMIAVGLALTFFFGLGAALIPPGGWLINAGTVLGRVASFLGIAVMGVRMAAMLFRTAGALFVPAEDFAEQLGAVSDDSNAFGNRVGISMGNQAANKTRQAVGDKFKAPNSNKDAGSADSKKGAAEGEAQSKEGLKKASELKADAEKAQKEIAKHKNDGKKKPTTKPKEAKETQAATKTEPKTSWSKSLGKNIGDVIRKPYDDLKGMRTTAGQLKSDLQRLYKDPALASDMGVYAAINLDDDGLANKKFREQADKKRAENDKRTADQKRLENQVEGIQKRKGDLDQRVSVLRQHINQLQAVIDSGQPVSQTDRNRLTQLRNDLQVTQGQIDVAKQQHQMVLNKIESNQKAIASNNTEIGRQQRVLNANETVPARLSREAKDAGELAKKEKALREKAKNEQALKDVNGEIRQLEKERGELKTQLNRLTKEKSKLRSNDPLHAHYDGLIKEVQSKRSDLRGQVESKSTTRDGIRADIDLAIDLQKQNLTADDLRAAHHQRLVDDTAEGNFRSKQHKGPGKILRQNSTSRVPLKKLLESFSWQEDITDGIDRLLGGSGSSEQSQQQPTDGSEPAATGGWSGAGGGSEDPEKKGPSWVQVGASMWVNAGKDAAKGMSSLFNFTPFGEVFSAPSPPPFEMEEMAETYERADKAAQEAVAAHASAYKAYQGELLVLQLIRNQKELDQKDGAEIEGAVTALGDVGNELEQTEHKRASMLSGADTKIDTPDGEQQSTMKQVSGKMSGKGEKYVKGGDPSAAGSAGGAAADGQATASQGADKAEKIADEGSEDQLNVLGQATSFQKQQHQHVRGQREALQGKIAHDEEELAAIRGMKATYLEEAAEKHAEAESEASSFNADMDSWAGWAAGYRKIRGG